MSLGHRSTTLGLVAKHCARALDYYERHYPYDRAVFGRGVAAHACVEDAGKASVERGRGLFLEEIEPVLRKTTDELISIGRDFEGEREPPLSPDVVYEGRDLALRFLADNPLSPTGRYEFGLAVNRHWQACPYGEEAYLRARIDRFHVAEPGLMDDSDGGMVAEADDFKSAWNVQGGPLGLQQKIQACLVWDQLGQDCESLLVVVINLRTGRRFDYPIYPRSQEGAAVLARWRADIDATIAALDLMKGKDGWRPASPGPNCMGCPYLAQCKEGKEAASAVYGSADPLELARAYAVHEAFVAAFAPLLKEATAEAPLKIDGATIGSVPMIRRVMGPKGPAVLAAAWNRKTHPETVEAARALVEGFIIRSGLTLTGGRKLLKHLYSSGADELAMRLKLETEITKIETVRRFGVHREGEEDQGDADE